MFYEGNLQQSCVTVRLDLSGVGGYTVKKCQFETQVLKVFFVCVALF